MAVKYKKESEQGWRPLAASLLKVGVSVILVYLLLRGIGWGPIRAQFGAASWGSLSLALGFFVVSNLLGALQWYLLLVSRQIRLPFVRILGYYHVAQRLQNCPVTVHERGHSLQFPAHLCTWSSTGTATVTLLLLSS